MVGAIIGVALLNIFFSMSYMPSYAKYSAQIIAGAFIGCSVEKSDIQRLKYVVKPALVILTSMMILNVTLGFLIFYLSPLDLITALMSCVPGGMSDIPLISADMGADAPKVALLQFSRMLAGTGLFPTLISIVARPENKKNDESESEKLAAPAKQTDSDGHTATIFAQTMTIAVAAGVIGKLLNIPAGAMLFSMFGVICLKLFFNRSYMPMWAKRLAQVLSGSYIGSGMGYSDILELKHLIVPALLLVLGYFIICFLVGRILSRRYGMSMREAMLAATPAGASDMALISADLGVQSTDLVVLQVIRLIVVISVFPQIINLIVRVVQ